MEKPDLNAHSGRAERLESAARNIEHFHDIAVLVITVTGIVRQSQRKTYHTSKIQMSFLTLNVCQVNMTCI